MEKFVGFLRWARDHLISSRLLVAMDYDIFHLRSMLVYW
jgi:hypothetical protein